MTLQQAKTKAAELYNNGKWIQLAILLLQFGKELIIYLRELLKRKQDDKTKNDTKGTESADKHNAS